MLPGHVALFLSWHDLRALASAGLGGLGSAREGVRRIRSDITRGVSSRPVPVVGEGSFPEGFVYAKGLWWENAPPHREDDVHARVVVAALRDGWCLRSAEDLEKGARVCDYAGDLVRSRTLLARKDLRYVLSLVEHSLDGSVAWKTIVDATERGGVARFVNHSCDPNLVVVPLRPENRIVPVLAFFTRKSVAKGKELTFDYAGLISDQTNLPAFGVGESGTACACGADNCRRWLPRHP